MTQGVREREIGEIGEDLIEKFCIFLPTANFQYPPKRIWLDNEQNKYVDLTTYYSLLFLGQIFGQLKKQDIEEESPIFKDSNLYKKQTDELEQLLKSIGKFFYQDPISGKQIGSVYVDYKIMRHLAYVRAGGCKLDILTIEEFDSLSEDEKKEIVDAYYCGLQTIRDMFSLEMTTDQAFQKAYEIVERYWWPEEKDITDPPNEEALNPE